MRVSFWGVRGSIPTSGSDTARYGGHTSCVCVEAEGAAPLVFDLGTGARALGRHLVAAGVDRVYVTLSHTHMDHLYALPYFDPIFHPGCRVHLGVPAASSEDARARIAQYLNGVFHPLRLDDIGERLHFYGVPASAQIQVGPYAVRTLRMVHPGGTIGYRATHGGRTVCYLTDSGPLAQPDEGLMAGLPPTAMERDLIALVEGADLMIMDTTFTQDEYHLKLSWGHAYPEYAVAVAVAASVEQVVLFHHNPDATDDVLDALAEKWSAHQAPRVTVAKEGSVMDLEG
jgi:phosphoribosyl 1,2-cyclic phosphodiesterase